MLDNSYENMSNVACFFIERIKTIIQLVDCMVVGKGKIYWFWMIRINIFPPPAKTCLLRCDYF